MSSLAAKAVGRDLGNAAIKAARRYGPSLIEAAASRGSQIVMKKLSPNQSVDMRNPTIQVPDNVSQTAMMSNNQQQPVIINSQPAPPATMTNVSVAGIIMGLALLTVIILVALALTGVINCKGYSRNYKTSSKDGQNK